MTRSELLEKAITNARTAIFCQQHGDYKFPALQEVRQFTLDLLLAELKRSEGCPLCRGLKCRNCNQKDRALCDYCDVNWDEGQSFFIPSKFCRDCGRDLTEGESDVRL